MKHLPFTYAVYYHAILSPNTITPQKTINWILFTGEPNPPKSHPEYFGTTVGCGYSSGDKTIRKTLIETINNLCNAELVRRIQLIGLQDIPAAHAKLLGLIELLDISEQLKKELLANAATTEMELFLGKIFQLSLKGNNRKIKVDESLKAILRNTDITIISQLLNPSQSENESDPLPSNSDTDTSSSPLTLDMDYVNYLEDLKQIFQFDENAPDTISCLTSPHLYYQELQLPKDYKLLMQFAAPFFLDAGVINLDLADFQAVCNIDFDRQICTEGSLSLIDVLCPANDLQYLSSVLPYVRGADSCLMLLTFGLDFGLMEATEIADTISGQINPDANLLFGLILNESLSNEWRVQLICNTDDSTKEKSPGYLTHEKINISQQPKPIKEKKKKISIDIPSFMNS